MSVGWGAWLAQSGEHGTVDLGLVNSGPMLGAEIILKHKILKSQYAIYEKKIGIFCDRRQSF